MLNSEQILQRASAHVVIASYNAEKNHEIKPIFSNPLPKSLKVKKFYASRQLVKKYTGYRIKLGRAKKKGIMQDLAILLIICDLIGFDDLNELDFNTVEYIKYLLSFYPTNANKNFYFNGVKGIDIINLNMKFKFNTLSNKTIKSHLQKFSTFCNWCLKHDYIKKNYFHKIEFCKNEEKKRHRFSNDQLELIFNIQQYIQHKYFHPYYYWVPLLLRYTGARLNELCQLRSNNIVINDGIYCIDINNFNGNEVKTTAGNRKIPIHDSLIDKGFIDFVNSKSSRLFPELVKVNGYYSHNASKWFARIRQKLGLGKGFDAHSFRHTMIDELKQLQVQKEVIECLVGHKHYSESFDTYSEQFNVHILKEAIDKIDSSITKHIKPYYQ